MLNFGAYFNSRDFHSHVFFLFFFFYLDSYFKDGAMRGPKYINERCIRMSI